MTTTPLPYDRAKRFLDIAVAVTVLVLASPLLLVVTLLVLVTMGRPVLFRQVRPGWHERPFVLAKFRTMRVGPGSDGERLTPLGRWLRATSLDELPTLWNVLRGDMSLVGPRPLLVEYLDRYTPDQRRRHDVRPGITGLAQVRGRNELAWNRRFAYDLWYVEHRCLRLDLNILLKTARAVVRRDGITATGHATAPEFLGRRAS